MNTVRKLSYRNDLGELQRLCCDVGAYCCEHGIDPDTALALTLCLDELFTNTIKYGYCATADSFANHQSVTTGDSGAGEATTAGCAWAVEIYLERHEDRVTVCYHDWGRPFDPFGDAPLLPEVAELPLESLPTGGFGIHLLRKLCSEVGYVRKGDTNIVSLALIWR